MKENIFTVLQEFENPTYVSTGDFSDKVSLSLNFLRDVLGCSIFTISKKRYFCYVLGFEKVKCIIYCICIDNSDALYNYISQYDMNDYHPYSEVGLRFAKFYRKNVLHEEN